MKGLSLLAVLSLMVLLGSACCAGAASLFTETKVFSQPSCSHTGSTDSSCSNTDGTANAHAEYGYLYVRTRVDPPPVHVGLEAYAKFEDSLTFSGSSAIARILADWDRSGLPCVGTGPCGDFFESLFSVPDLEPYPPGSWTIWASLYASGDFDSFPRADFEGTLRLTSLRVFDEEMNQLSGLLYRSASGHAYPVEGATQLPEQPTVALTGIGLLAAVLLRWHLRIVRQRSGLGGAWQPNDAV